MYNSEFDGNFLEYIGYYLLMYISTFVSFGILYPFTYILFKRWEVSHTIIEGNRLVFEGKISDYYLKCIIWALLSLITLGIYGLIVPMRQKQWETENTHFFN